MPKKTFAPEQIVAKLRQIEVLVSHGESVAAQRLAIAEVGDQAEYPPLTCRTKSVSRERPGEVPSERGGGELSIRRIARRCLDCFHSTGGIPGISARARLTMPPVRQLPGFPGWFRGVRLQRPELRVGSVPSFAAAWL